MRSESEAIDKEDCLHKIRSINLVLKLRFVDNFGKQTGDTASHDVLLSTLPGLGSQYSTVH